MNSSSSRGDSNSSVNSEIHYNLPLDIKQISNFQDILSVFQLSEAAKNMLVRNGFAVIRHHTEQYDTEQCEFTYVYPSGIYEVYKNVRIYGIPMFVTCDSLLYELHATLDNILKTMEEESLFDKVLKMTKTFLSESRMIFSNVTNNELKEAARLNIAYFSVALKLLVHEEDVPRNVADLVASELANIGSSSQISNSVIFGYEVDYTQFTTRGHYSDSEKLQNYFKALMWYGMMSFKLSNIMQVIQAALIVYILSKNEMVRNEFDSLKLVTEFFAGAADDIGPYEFLNITNNLANGNFDLQHLTQEDFLEQLKIALDKLPPPRISGGTSVQRVIVPSFSPDAANKILSESRGMRLIGQRFTLDSYIFSNLVLFEHTGDTQPFTAIRTQNGNIIRVFPTGLDLMAILGSTMARDLLQYLGDSKYNGYHENFSKLQNELESYDSDME